MNSMEQDIKNLQEIINLCNEELDNEDENVTAVLDLVDLKSLSNLIKSYKKLEEEKKDLKDKLNSSRKANEKLSEKNRNLQIEKETAYSEAINNIIAGVDLDNSFIPVSLVEEKIEELTKEGRHYNANKIEVLQELLEKR